MFFFRSPGLRDLNKKPSDGHVKNQINVKTLGKKSELNHEQW